MLPRWFAIVFVTNLLIQFAGQATVRADSFPITAYLQDSAVVRSGPAEKFYATQQLPIGSAVEIYKTTDDGWCGIRPLPNSFSVIPTDAVTPDIAADANTFDIAKLNREGIRTRVGSLISREKNVKYVTLHKGEPVRVLGFTPDRAWLKIAPPSGEFRWIHKRSLGSAKPSVDPNPSVTLASFDMDIPVGTPVGSSIKQTPPQRENAPAELDSVLVENARPIGTQMKTRPIEAEVDETVQSSQSPPSAPATADATVNDAWQVRNSPASAKPQSTKPNSLAASTPFPTITSEVGQINVALSQIVTQETSKWDLTSVRARAERIVDGAATQSDRQAGRELLKRIADFESLQRRYDAMSGRSTDVTYSPKPGRENRSRNKPVDFNNNVDLASFLQSNNRDNRNRSTRIRQASSAQLVAPASQTDQSRTGWLMPVITSNPNMPKFALTNDEGSILCFVSEGAGVKLKSHLRSNVKITGESGFSARLKKVHFVATQVVSNR